MASGDYSNYVAELLQDHGVRRLHEMAQGDVEATIVFYEKEAAKIEKRQQRRFSDNAALRQEDYEAVVERLKTHLERRAAGDLDTQEPFFVDQFAALPA